MIAILVYAIVGVLFLALCIVLYSYAVSTRRAVVCASCGDRINMEHDRVTHCPTCGGPLS